MNINSQFSYYPPQPDNPSDTDRHILARYALAEKGRPEDFDYILKNMNPPPDITSYARPGAFKGLRVGIIGGGLAGMSAAFELRKLGFDITVFEALEDRVGGRVYTYYFDEQKTNYGEFGSMRIPVTHETVWHYLKLFRLPTRPFIQVDNNTFIYFHNIRVRNDPDGLNVKKYIYPKYNLTPWEKNLSWQELFNFAAESPLFNASPQERQEIIRVQPFYNNKTLFWNAMSNIKMMEYEGLNQGAIDLISNFSSLLKGNLYNSYIDYVQESYPVSLSYLYEIPGGSSRLPYSFYNSLLNAAPALDYTNLDIKLLGQVSWKAGAWVKGILYNGSDRKVSLQYQQRNTGENMEDSFDYVVCAIPFSSLRNINITPLFSNIKMRAIREVNYSTSQKSLMLCKQRFWEKAGIIGGSSFTDLPISSISYPSDHANIYQDLYSGKNKFMNYPSDMPGVILCSYSFNLDATRLTSLPPDLYLEEVKREIEEVHGLPQRYLDNIVEDIKFVNWDNQPSFRGSLCFLAPDQKKLFSFGMAVPEYNDRIFFAGEHISAVHRWMQGALQSGMQAANSLASACRLHKS